MKKNIFLEINDLEDWKNLLSIYDNVLGLSELDHSFNHLQMGQPYHYSRFRTNKNKISMIWMRAGECDIVINEMSYHLQKNSFILVPPSNSIQITYATTDLKARMLIVEKHFMDECINNKQILSFFNCLFVKRLLQTELDIQEIKLLDKLFFELKNKIDDGSHSFYKELIPVNFMSFLLELSNLLSNKEEGKVFQQFTRKEQLFNKFMDLLLDHYKEQHEVTFYADKLFITPQYLTMIIKNLTGKTTNKWIDDALLLEARKMLKTTQTTIQQIADTLNFSDQSTFGKFFKKHHGMSPVEYRKLQFSACGVAV